jgi:MFS family permease
MPTDPASRPALAGLDPGGISASAIDDESERRTHDRRTLRLGIGVTITFLIAMLYDWTLAYLAPIFVIPLLKAPVGPSLGAAARMLLGTFVVFVGGLCSAGLAQVYPAFFLMALFPALFLTFRFLLRGGSVLMTLFALCGLILLPLMAGTRIEVGRSVALSFVQNIAVSLAVTMLMYALIPPLPTEPAAKPKPVLPQDEVTRRAALLTMITGSYAVLYLCFGWSNVHTPIYIALYACSLDLSRGSAAAKGILAANIAAGLLAMLLYQLTLMAPYVPFVAVMILTVNLVLARMILSKAPWAQLASFALSVLMILYGDSIRPFSDSGGANFLDRFGELAMAAIWAIGALTILETYFPTRSAVVDNGEPHR